MDKEFYDFIKTPNRELFLRSRATVVAHPDYNPYSDDIRKIDDLLAEGKYEEAVAHRNINTVLSARAHLLHAFAFSQIGMEQEERSMSVVGGQLIENILMTGNGSLEHPYIVTRVEDERDVLTALQERATAQALVHENGRYYDRMTTQSGRDIYFDITDVYTKLQKSHLTIDDLLKDMADEEPQKPDTESVRSTKKWWKFWA
jgi:Domain of unknown function (DUF4919)